MGSSVSHIIYSRARCSHLIEQLLLDGGIEDYDYLNKSRREVDGVDDREEWKHLKVNSFIPGHDFM